MIAIRKAVKTDLSAITAFQQEMAFETESLTLDQLVVLKGVEAVISDPAKGFYLIAAENDQLIACLLITYEWSDWRNGMYLWLQSLYVIPAYRKQGVFRQLYDHVKSMVNESDELIGLKLYVDDNNEIAQQAYKRTGMQQSHYRLFHWLK